MREASTADRNDQVVIKEVSGNYRTAVRLELDNSGTWEPLNDVDVQKGINWSESGKKERYANISLTPLPGTISFNVYNENGKYSDGSGTAFEGLIDKETKVRLQAGPILSSLDGVDVETSLNLNQSSGLFIGSYYHQMAYDATPQVKVTQGATSGIPSHFKDYNLYDSLNYDSATYSLDAYVIATYDTYGQGYQNVNKITVTANNTNGTIYYRTFNSSSAVGISYLTNWTNGGATANGDTDISVSLEGRYIQVAVVYDGISWADDNAVTAIKVTSQSYVEWLYKSVYYLDRPSFTDPKAPQPALVVCKGRDAYKKAIITDVNLEDLSAGVAVDQLIKDVCDQIGILYNASSIGNLSDFPNRVLATGVELKKADTVFEWCMQLINTEGYQMFMKYNDTLEDNIMYVQPKPTTADASGAFNYKNYESIDDVSKNSDRILQRFTTISNDQTPQAEERLDALLIDSTGAKSLSWTSTAGGGNAEFKRLVFDFPNNITISNFEATPTSFTFDVDSITGSVYAIAYGNKWDSDPDFEGEAFAIDNHKINQGITYKNINSLVISDNECKELSESFANDYGEPTIEARGLRWPYCNLRPEINDLFMLWRRFIFTNDVFFVTKITHHWSAGAAPNEYSVYNLDDTGLDRGDPFWDDGTTQWDKGWVWDMGISTSLNTNAEIDAIADALVINNTDFI